MGRKLDGKEQDVNGMGRDGGTGYGKGIESEVMGRNERGMGWERNGCKWHGVEDAREWDWNGTGSDDVG